MQNVTRTIRTRQNPLEDKMLGRTGPTKSLICSHLHPVQHGPDHRSNACCGLLVVVGDALQHHLICPANQLSHRVVEAGKTGGDSLTAERTDGEESGTG